MVTIEGALSLSLFCSASACQKRSSNSEREESKFQRWFLSNFQTFRSIIRGKDLNEVSMEQSILSCTPLTILIMMKYIARLIARAKSKAIEQLFVGIRSDDRNFDPCVFRFDRKVNIVVGDVTGY